MLLNKERALELMKEARVDALIATQPENVTYMTNFENWMAPGFFPYRGITMSRGFQCYAVLTPDGSRGLITHCLSEATAMATYGWKVDDYYVYGTAFMQIPETYEPQPEDVQRWIDYYNSETNHTVDAVTALIKHLKKHGISRGRVAVELANLAPGAEQTLQDEFNQVEFIDAGELLARIRYVKTPEEIERLRHAAEVNERALEEVLKAIKSGVTEIAMRKVYRAALAQDEGDLDFFTCAGGMRAGIWAVAGNYCYKPGDHVLIDVGCRINCYHADTGVCGVLGEPTKKHKEMWNGLNEVWNAGVSILGPGLRPTQLFDAMAEVQKKIFGHVGGYFAHCIGIECREGPFANRVSGAGQRLMDAGEDPPYEVGMVVCIEIPTPIVGYGGVHKEETFIITENGCEPIIHTIRDLYSFSC
jgi:Xaa-Pro dipeptidase